MSEIDLENLLQKRVEGAAPSRAFEERLLAAMQRKQRELGRTPSQPLRITRIAVAALTALAASAVFSLQLATWRPAPAFSVPVAPSAPQIAITVTTTAPSPPPPVSPLPPVSPPTPTPPPAVVPVTTRDAVVTVPPVAPRPVAPAAVPAVIVEAKAPLRRELEDGSVLFLDAGARVELGERRVKIDRGRGFVEVAAKPDAKPFCVESADTRATAHGTKFAFDLKPAGLEVAVAQGTVELAPSAETTASRRARLLRVGEWGGLDQEIGPAPRLSWLCEWMKGVYCPVCKTPLSSLGRLVARDPWGQELALDVRDVKVDVYIEDGVARTTIDTTYFNQSFSRVEGTFSFLVPPGASVSRLAMYVNGALMEGGCLERKEARQVYEQIRYEVRRDPALLEWMEGNAYKMRIFPLEPRQEKRVLVSFTQELEPLYGTLRYALPLEVRSGPAYKHFAIHVRVKNAKTAPESSWKLDASRDQDDIVLDHEEGPARPAKDLVLKLAGAEVPRTATLEAEDARYVLARFTPSFAKAPRKHEPRHFAVVVEESGARSHAELIAQNELVARLLTELDDKDTFQLFSLATRVERLSDKWAPCRTSSLDAIAFLDSQRALGAVDMAKGLAAAALALKGQSNPHLVYVGQGVPSLGERDPNRLVDALGDKTVFVGLGVGRGADESLLASLAARTGGTYALVATDEPIAWRVFDLVAALATPRLTGFNAIALDARGSVVPGEIFPSKQTAADGEEVRILGRFSPTSKPDRILISAFQGDEPVSRIVSLSGAREDALYLPRLWARRHVEALIRDGAEQHKDEITALGKRFFLATPFTSLIVLENDAMYRQFGVEPAPRDPFAFYETPKRIPVVSEWNEQAPLTDEEALEETIVGYGAGGVSYADPRFVNLRPDINGNIVPEVGVGWNTRRSGDFNQRAAFVNPEAPFAIDYDQEERRQSRGDWNQRAGFQKLLAQPLNGSVYFGKDFNGNSDVFTARVLKSHDAQWRARDYFYKKYERPLAEPPADVFFKTPATHVYSGPPNPQNLVSLCPGLELRSWDVPAFLERELKKPLRATKQDPAALALLARARSVLGTRSVRVGDREGFVSGDGRVCLRRTLGTGLEELLLATRDALYEAYPALGLCARRERSRFSDLWLGAELPFLPPTARALDGWDLALRGENGVALTAGEERIEIDFTPEGLVKERRTYTGGVLVDRATVTDSQLLREGRPQELALHARTKAASFEPRFDGFLVVSLPARTPAHLEAALQTANDKDRPWLEDQLAFAHFLTGQPIYARPHESRRGIFVLRLAANTLTPVEAEDLAKRDPGFGDFAKLVVMSAGTDRAKEAVSLARRLKSGVWAGLARHLAAVDAISTAAYRGDGDRDDAFAFAQDDASSAPCSVLTLELARFLRTIPEIAPSKVADIYDRIPAWSDLAVSARLESAQVYSDSGEGAEAARRFQLGYAIAMERGEFPPFAASLRDRLGAEGYAAFMEHALAWAKDRPFALVAIAASDGDGDSACRALRLLPEPVPAALGERILAQLLPAVAARAYTAPADSERILRALIERPSLARTIELRDALSPIALRQGHTAAAAIALEEALALETIGSDYNSAVQARVRSRTLFQLYEQLAGALAAPGQPPRALVARILRSFERVRSLDPDDPFVASSAATALLTCGEADLAFAVATTPIAQKPAEGASFQTAAEPYARAGLHAQAAPLYARAAELEPQDPTPRLQEAKERIALGERGRARTVLDAILAARETWHARFANVVYEADQLRAGLR